ncbi:leucyl aminopeptidase [Sphingosinicella humi]|uniref:Probable cytosol aminopeptidase n=1 Tax=Allosphingosinicella humi TaxID=2068657 RepID=A0A2U2IZ89_9SPHN|nr:leucyl aminopeptidase [Sphingosinicella humi]PWG01400.1 leucyl aminopeptidase [Sphingosinicella humi]
MRYLAAIALMASALTPAVAARPIAFADSAPQTGALVLPLSSAEDLAAQTGLHEAVRGVVGAALRSADFDYEAGSSLTLRGIGPWSQLVIVGTGDEALDAAALQDIGGKAAAETAQNDGPVTLVATHLARSIDNAAVQLGVGARLGGYSFDRYKYADPKDPRPAGLDAPFTIVTGDAAAAETRFRREGQPLAEAVTFTRDLISEPANVVYPESFVARTQEAFQGVGGVTIEVLDVPAMERLGMGSILSVGRGSARPPRMMIVEYKGSGAPANPIVLAGKGITFDSGGISLKPGSGMWEMKTDMSGAAAVVGTVLSLAKRQAPVHVVAIAALAENMPGGGATRPGDVVKANNGKTIEIINTDAEGRLVLADAVAYADKRYDPAAIVDVATLTGAVVRALGSEYAGLFSRHDNLADQLAAAGQTTGEELWRLPLHPSYSRDVKSDIADIKNSGEGAPGAGYGAHFIGFFVEPETPWAHIDIAGTAWNDADEPTVPAGAAAYGVRLLDRFVQDFQPVPRGKGQGGY